MNGRLVDELKTDIPLVSMYSYPTVKLLAKFIDQGNGKGDILDKEKEKLLKEFLNRIASSDIKDVEDLIDLEQAIETFIEQVEVGI